MDHAKRGADALAAGNFTDAIACYTKAISTSPTSPDYLIKRSTAYQRCSPPDHVAALFDAENAVLFAQQRAKRELIIQAQMRRAIALFGLERYGDANFVLAIVKRMDDKEKSLPLWTNKMEMKLKGLAEDDAKRKVTVTETPAERDAPAESPPAPIAPPAPDGTASTQRSAEKIKHTWYQTSDAVSFTLFAKGVPKDQARVVINDHSLAITFPLANAATYDISFDPLFDAVDVAKSRFDITSTKIEVSLRKAQPGLKWKTLEGAQTIGGTPTASSRSISTTVAPSYPTSSRNGPKDWDKLAADLTTKKRNGKSKAASADDNANANANDDEDDEDYDYDKEDGDETNAFFKKLYAGASPDVRRAMMKSFTESNGTALSTNWEEVGRKKVEVSPPDGMEAKKWES